jgi:hypothetical protein
MTSNRSKNVFISVYIVDVYVYAFAVVEKSARQSRGSTQPVPGLRQSCHKNKNREIIAKKGKTSFYTAPRAAPGDYQKMM